MKSRYKGVYPNKGPDKLTHPWKARLALEGSPIQFLGTFATEEAAAAAHLAAYNKLRGRKYVNMRTGRWEAYY